MRVVPYAEFLERRATDACVVGDGELISAVDLQPADVEGCTFKDGSGFLLYVQDEEPEAPQPASAPRKKTQPVSTVAPTVEVLADAVPASTPTEILSSLPIPALDGGMGQAQALMDAPANLQAVLPKGADANGYTVLLGVVAVAGGGAAWKFYNDYSKRKHEENMARIEREPQEDSHKKCEAARTVLEQRVNDVHAKVSALNVRLDAIHESLEALHRTPASPAFDASDLEDRLALLEKAAKKKVKKGTK